MSFTNVLLSSTAKRCDWTLIPNSDAPNNTYVNYGEEYTVDCDFGYGLLSNSTVTQVKLWCRPDGNLVGSTEVCSRRSKLTA